MTISTADTPHVLPTTKQLADLAGCSYTVQRNSTAPWFLVAVLVPASQLTRACAPGAPAAV